MSTPYSTIRDIIGHCIGQRIIEITQHDEEEWVEDRVSYVALHLENGVTLTFPIDDSFGVDPDESPAPDDPADA